jgi:uncharacterized protein (DUF302 family)
VQRFSVTSFKSFDEVVAGLEAVVGHSDMNAFRRDIASATTYAELGTVLHRIVGVLGFMEFTRFDIGEILRKERGEKAPHSLRLLVGNPLMMNQMVEYAPDAGSYAPVTILVDERPDGVHLSYDTTASFLASYGSPEALKVARDLDSKVKALLTAAAHCRPACVCVCVHDGNREFELALLDGTWAGERAQPTVSQGRSNSWRKLSRQKLGTLHLAITFFSGTCLRLFQFLSFFLAGEAARTTWSFGGRFDFSACSMRA